MQQERDSSCHPKLNMWPLLKRGGSPCRYLATVVIGVVGTAVAADPLVEDLAARLARTDPATVNAHLSANWESKMSRLGRLVRRCDPAAVRLSVSLLDTTNLEAYQGHVFALELAMGKCLSNVLPVIPTGQVRAVCAIDAYSEVHRGEDIVAEIDRRIRKIRSAPHLVASPNGQTCLEAYLEARSARQ